VAESLDSIPKTSLGQYEVKGRLGSGGMGDVYDAVHTSLNKRVAIKTLRRRFLDDETVVARFLREGQLASRMRHPNIVDVTDVGMIGGLPCLVMEHLEGESLGQMIRRQGPLAVSALVDMLLPIIAAVEFAHEHGVLHRDLKPSNIFLSRAWNGEIVPKVLDFGISKLVHESAQAALTTDSAFVGTPHYASPELMRADKNADGRSDQYSMGVILYEATTGVRPFQEQSGNFVGLAMAICNGTFAPPRQVRADLPESFERVILQAMALHAQSRFSTMGGLGAALLPFATERARMIWAPTFGGRARAPAVGETALFAPSSPMLAPSPQVASHPGSASGVAPLTGAPWPANPMTPVPNAGSALVSGTPPPGAFGLYPSTSPPGMHERAASFGPAAASMPGTPPPRSSGLLVVIGAALLAMLAIGFVVAKYSSRASAAADAQPSVAAPPPESDAVLPATYAVEVTTIPAETTIEIDGVAVGAGHVSRTFPHDGQKHVLRVSAADHETLLVEFDETRPPPERISLRPIAHAGGKASSGGAPSTGGGASRGGGSGGKGKTGDSRPKTDNIDPWE
jgi:serine/threonine protein kinase